MSTSVICICIWIRDDVGLYFGVLRRVGVRDGDFVGNQRSGFVDVVRTGHVVVSFVDDLGD